MSLIMPRREKTCLRGFRNLAVKPQKMIRGLKFRIEEVEGLYYLCRKNKGPEALIVTAQLIFAFVFTYAKNRFSHDAAQ